MEIYVFNSITSVVTKRDIAPTNKYCTDQKNKECMNSMRNTSSCNSLVYNTYANNTPTVDSLPDLMCTKGTSPMSSILTHAHTWHKRLAHAPLPVLQYISQLNISPTIPEEEKTKLKSCEACHKAKQTRLPFLTRTHNATTIFKIVHADIWGQYT